VVSCLGNSQSEVLDSLREGRSGISFNEGFAEKGLRSQVCGSVDIDTADFIDRKVRRFMGDAAAYSYIAMQQAIDDAGLEESDVSNPRTGLIASMSSTVSACLATPFHIKGLNYSITSACATSAHCIGAAMEQIQLGKQDLVFAGGGEEEDWTLASMFDAMGALSSGYNDAPATASRTYDVNRDGFVIAAGAGIVVVEELERAQARGAKIYAEVVGYGATSDGFDMVAPSGEGAVRCMEMGRSTVESPIDYINTHGTSTPVGDTKELEAMREVFGEDIPRFASSKSLCGHSLGATGVQESIHCLLMLEHDFIAPSINVVDLDPAAEGMPLITERVDNAGIRTAMTNSFGFGGTNATLVFQKL
jgi:3-oxoacyl-[acyl-carrier-protein] synthase-1